MKEEIEEMIKRYQIKIKELTKMINDSKRNTNKETTIRLNAKKVTYQQIEQDLKHLLTLNYDDSKT